ncbi:SMC-Scp complex subunit ScpB [Leucobacter sp. UT-8R-CII-1-4]|uniref:SMC-Scp complex subunit ScpB n=1 Tax=Leucobacter sp. UT-8R-CII-1-4 TaxID=3040075 RepID=UPI0024A9D439|nr:SMC-Scp complex subunit ScpB [Leucobacter sp. UT-8R-CII-1-4]MDI6022051.1 SMC-Scp complex subunit ScpB [Leucobacter sp. UT-8R-CII-1-4]
MTDNTETQAVENPGSSASDTPGLEQSSEASTALESARAAHPLQQQLEALLLVADEPIGAVHLATAVDRPVREVRKTIEALIDDYNGAGENPQRGFELREVAGGYRFYVRESLDTIVADFVQQQSPTKLSQAALETLAVIAYRQPISRGAIASVRAVNVDSVVRTLVGRGLVTEVGHDNETGAILYGTDDTLLGHLGISSIDELPPIAPLLDDPDEGFSE